MPANEGLQDIIVAKINALDDSTILSATLKIAMRDCLSQSKKEECFEKIIKILNDTKIDLSSQIGQDLMQIVRAIKKDTTQI
jgi:hypothetical protein